MPFGSERVLELLTYIEQVEKLKIKPAFSVPTEYFAAHQHELKGLPEIRFNIQAEGEDIWLSIPRLKEIPPPEPDEKLAPWITVYKTPAKDPELKPGILTPSGPEIPEQERDRIEILERFNWYVQNQWTPWAAAELPRRKTIHRYNQLFAVYQILESDGADTALELIWGIGFAVWKKEGARSALKFPLITQACEINLNRHTFELEVRPRDVEARIELDCYAEMELSGVHQVEAFWRSSVSTSANRVNPFELSTFEPTLKAAVGLFDPSGSYELLIDDPTPPAPSDKLRMTNTWVLFARKRTGTIFLEDVNRLKENVQKVHDLPAVIRSFVEQGDSEVRVKPDRMFRGLLSSEAPADAAELYFPLPYNDEQVSIIRKLEHDDGVVVQGPPGTGKTHTIANIICHYLALGKRVLVSSKGETALTEVIGKLPERIRPLSVALLSNEREGMKQFEHSIQSIASNVAALNPMRSEQEIARLEDLINRRHAKISQVDATLREYATKHMCSYRFRDGESSPEEIAKFVVEHGQDFGWMDDALPVDGIAKIRFDNRSIGELRRARIRVGKDLSYLDCSLPVVDDFPAWPDLLNIHHDLAKAKSIDDDVSRGAVLGLIDSTAETYESAAALLQLLASRQALNEKIAEAPQAALIGIGEYLAKMSLEDILLDSLMQVCQEVNSLESTRRDLVGKAVVLPIGAEENEDFAAALERLKNGKGAFALPFGKRDARKLVEEVIVLGSAPAKVEQWELVSDALEWRVAAKKCVARWNSVVAEFGLTPQNGDIDDSFKRIVLLRGQIVDLHKLAFEFDAKLPSAIERVFGQRVVAQFKEQGDPLLQTIQFCLQVHLDRRNLASALLRHEGIKQKLIGREGPIVDNIQEFLTAKLGNRDIDEIEPPETVACSASRITSTL